MELRQQRLGDALDMGMRVLGTGAVEPRRRIAAEAVIGGIEVGMLSGQDQGRPRFASRQCSGDGGKLDCLGPRADDQPNVCGLQASP